MLFPDQTLNSSVASGPTPRQCCMIFTNPDARGKARCHPPGVEMILLQPIFNTENHWPPHNPLKLQSGLQVFLPNCGKTEWSEGKCVQDYLGPRHKYLGLLPSLLINAGKDEGLLKK